MAETVTTIWNGALTWHVTRSLTSRVGGQHLHVVTLRRNDRGRKCERRTDGRRETTGRSENGREGEWTIHAAPGNVTRKERRHARTHAFPHTIRAAEFEVATYSTVIKQSGQVINAYYVASLTVICLKQYNVGYEERAAHFGPRDLIKLTRSGIIAPLPRDSRLSLPVTQSEMRRRAVGRPKVTTAIWRVRQVYVTTG